MMMIMEAHIVFKTHVGGKRGEGDTREEGM
jgi:hypothetical protein